LGLAFRSRFGDNSQVGIRMSSLRLLGIGLLLIIGQISASAADLAILKNGSAIPFLRKEQVGAVTRLYIPGGHMDISTSEIASYDRDDSPLESSTPAPQPMAAVDTAATTVSAAAATPILTPAKVNIDELVRDASSRHQLDPDFVASVIKAESNFNAHAVSPKGARGLMQLMPQTATQLGVADAFDPRANVEAGTAHLSALLDQYNNDPIKALAAYNAGAHRVQQYHGIPPYRETRAYVSKIVRDFNARKRAEMKAAPPDTKAAPLGTKTASKGAVKAHATGKTAKRPLKRQPQQASVPKAIKPA
jgi:transglycosylase-like protein with SLT domain